jgi:LmbE family N-acetylglucosaminyl deacetylase
MVTTEITGYGTDERIWRSWLGGVDLPRFPQLTDGQRIVVVAAHPDDEVLGVGGLLSTVSQRHPVVVVWASDGEASHPGSTAIPASTLAEMRREESRRALVRLGVVPRAVHRLGLPDGHLDECRSALRSALRGVIRPTDLVLSNWCGDGHPDHEAVGEAVRGLAPECWQYPIWMWDWASPGDSRVPWAAAVEVARVDVLKKAAAIAEFVTQVEAIGPAAADAAILPPRLVAHFVRSNEVLFSA